jgi:hypothetical protein
MAWLLLGPYGGTRRTNNGDWDVHWSGEADMVEGNSLRRICTTWLRVLYHDLIVIPSSLNEKGNRN